MHDFIKRLRRVVTRVYVQGTFTLYVHAPDKLGIFDMPGVHQAVQRIAEKAGSR